MVQDPEIIRQAENDLDSQFRSLVRKTAEVAAASRYAAPPTQRVDEYSVTFAVFNSQDNHSTPASSRFPSQRLRICTPQPDELLQGWQARMRAINHQPGEITVDQLISKIARQHDISITDETDFAQCAAVVLGMSRESLLQNLTLAPFFNGLEGLKPNKHGTKSLRHRQAYDRTAPFKLGGHYPRFCLQCAKKDISVLGYSYWHRSHQLPGLIWCPEHGSQLIFAKGKNVFEQRPDQVADSFIDERVHSFTQIQVNILKRYGQIATNILHQAPVIDSVAASAILNRQAKRKDFRISRPGKRNTASNELIRLLPTWWLHETSPRVKWIPNKYISTIDGACTPNATRYTAVTLSLLAALFYEDENEAIVEILKPYERTQERQKGFNYWASREIFEEYIAQKGIVSRVAEKLSLPSSTVGIGLLNQGLPGLGRASSTTMAARAFLLGQPLATACAENGTSKEELEELLRAGCARLKTALDAIPEKIAPYVQPAPRNDKRQASG